MKRQKSFALSARVPSFERDRPPGGPPLVTPQLNGGPTRRAVKKGKKEWKWVKSCGIPRGLLRRQVAQGGLWHVPLKDPSRVGSCSRFRLVRPHLDRSRKLVGLQSPATSAKRADGDSDPIIENYDFSTPVLRTPNAVFTPGRCGRTGTSASGASFSGDV